MVIFRELDPVRQLRREVTRLIDRLALFDAAAEDLNPCEDDADPSREGLASERAVSGPLGISASWRQVIDLVGRVAFADSTVLVTGESGTGKELVARKIHQRSRRLDAPLVKVNCAALPTSLIESELFGHERGAFTGAVGRRVGRFEQAGHGTLFLDEIGELPLESQAKLLRVLQEREFERVGGTQTLRAHARVVAATNRNLEDLVQSGRFRNDLFHRLNVFPVHLPPLRQRREDIPLLARHFVKKVAPAGGGRVQGLSIEAERYLSEQEWPGNVRELENAIERAVVLSEDEVLEPRHFDLLRSPPYGAVDAGGWQSRRRASQGRRPNRDSRSTRTVRLEDHGTERRSGASRCSSQYLALPHASYGNQPPGVLTAFTGFLFAVVRGRLAGWAAMRLVHSACCAPIGAQRTAPEGSRLVWVAPSHGVSDAAAGFVELARPLQ